MVNDDGTPANLFDITGIVGGQKNGDALLHVQLSNQFADALLGNDIQPDGGLIEKNDRGFVHQGGRQFAAHALAQAQLARGRANVIRDIKDFDQEIAPFAVLCQIKFVDACQQVECILRRQVIPQLRFLAIDTGYTKSQFAPFPPGGQPKDGGFAARWIEDAGQHFDGRGFACTVGANEGQHFSCL